ncbi:MAG TPA: response regulator transcription factor, partial [Gemmatimonadaceae bacterium]|nr:response regulator transcription factor [Gemmatimonadaceae bacterium]
MTYSTLVDHRHSTTDSLSTTMPRILIVEDNPDLAYGLRTGLEIEGYEVQVAEDGETGLDRAQSWTPDLVMLDLMLPGMDGYRVLKTLREGGSDVPVLILTARGEEADKVLGFRLGADDYVTKPCGVLELLARVGALLRRSRLAEHRASAADGLERFGVVEINPASRTVTKEGTPVALSPKEFDLLVSLVRRRGAVASRVDLLREVWGHRVEVMTRTVDIHIAELRRKLEDDPSQPRHILTV